jgi:LiaF transmembrane domain
MTPPMRRRGPHFFIGLLFVGWGVLQLFDTLGLMEFRDAFRTYWPLALVVWGGWNLLTGHVVERVFGVGVIVLGGVLLGNRLYGWGINLFALWPLVLIALGLRIMLGGGRQRRWQTHHMRDRYRRRFEARYGGPATFEATATAAREDASGPTATTADDGAAATHSQDADARTEDTSATFREFAVLGGVERRSTSQAFRGGEATAFLGGIELDLRECRMADTQARIEVFACMGGISMRIPRDWTVQSEVAAILGGFHNQSTPPVDGNARRLIITGQAVMGGIEVMN